MDSAHADARAAREHLAGHGWISARNESFRHLHPPGAETWLGTADTARPPLGDPAPSTGSGWTLHPMDNAAQGHLTARWLDAGDPAQRAALFAGLPLPGEGDAAPFAWAHRALCRQGLRLRVAPPAPGLAPAPVPWLQLHYQPGAAVEAPLLVLEVPDGAHCVLVEMHGGGARPAPGPVTHNLYLHIHLGQGARLQHLRLVSPAPGDQIAHHVHAQLGTGAHYAQALVAAGSRYHLQRTVLALQGTQACTRTAGLLFAADTALEQQTHTRHHAPLTHSNTEALALVSGKAHAVVNAHTHIAAGADDAAVRQRLTGIPLARQPRLVLRPHLEIEHDNVQAAHGATWGSLPEDALFYARQRGLDAASARALIVRGMATALLDRCFGSGAELLASAQVGDWLTSAIARHLPTQPETSHG